LRRKYLRGRSRGGSTAATAEATTELGVELARGGALLALASVTATVLAALAVATGTTTAAAGTLLAAEHAAGGSVGALLLDVGLGDDLGGEVEPLAEVVEALGGEAMEEGVSCWKDEEGDREEWTGPRIERERLTCSSTTARRTGS
jgi:hypothetical protein